MTGIRVALVLLLAGGGTATLHAQQTTSPYAGYGSPVACLGVLMRINVTIGWNTLDTMPLDENDILPKAARDTTERCLRQFYPSGPDVAKVPDHEVATHFFWGRASGNDSLAARAFRRALGQQKLRIDTTDLLWHGAYSYSSRPFRLPVAQEMAKRLDALGVVGERPMMIWNDYWVSQHDGPGGLAKTLFDTTAMKVETAGELRNYEALPDTARHGAEMTGIMTEAQSVLLALVRNPRNDSAGAALRARAIEILGKDQQEGRYGEGLLLLGERWPALKPDFWFNRPSADSVFPRPGRVTIIQPIGIQQCLCEAVFASINRIKQRFGDSVDILLVVETQGHWARRVQLSPAEEAGLLKRAVIDSLKLPVTLGVYTTTFIPHPAPDNRLVPQVIPEMKKITFANSAIIVDRRGIAQLAGVLSFGAWNERPMMALLASLVSAPAN
jgi:hypothetical protein